MRTPEDIQRTYYTKTASRYDEMHTADQDDEHYAALESIDMLCDRYKWATLLDVGAGTGRGVRFLLDRGRDVRGIEPVAALIAEAESAGLPKARITEGSGYSLPYEDSSVDAVFECGVLHHVAEPSRVVNEMMRVASKAVFISDYNRFGQGRAPVRMMKLLLYKLRLWNATRWLQTKGKMYTISEGDGLAYSYSVFDSYDQLAEWADSIWLIPTRSDGSPVKSWMHPLLTASHVLLCAIRNGPEK